LGQCQEQIAWSEKRDPAYHQEWRSAKMSESGFVQKTIISNLSMMIMAFSSKSARGERQRNWRWAFIHHTVEVAVHNWY
jgi:hypothetical protein